MRGAVSGGVGDKARQFALAPLPSAALACDRPMEDLMSSVSEVAVATAPAVVPMVVMCSCACCCL
jgi:hypothetical protein